MAKISTPLPRKIINDFAEEIKSKRIPADPPRTAVIDFRNEVKRAYERPIYLVPIDILRYRKDNGRISSDVINYEIVNGPLDENEDKDQKIIETFLEEKDKDKTNDLQNAIYHKGQREPAIITSDGFLINGNRRKMVMEKLLKLHPGREDFEYLKVVILPGKDDEGDFGGPPTQLEIEKIENRYQLQTEGKAEYYGFDEALSIRRKIELGMSLEEQLKDDPAFVSLNDRKFKSELKAKEENTIKPLECVDRYLSILGRDGLYSTISRGLYDSEGRWQAFIDYYKSVHLKIIDKKARLKIGLDEEDVGKVEDSAYKIIRKRQISGFPKVHSIMRSLTKYIGNEDSKKELLKLVNIENDIPEEDRYDEKGDEYSEREIDKIWGKKHEETITKQLKKADQYYEMKKEKETPIDLLETSLKKLNHEDMLTSAVSFSDIPKAMRLCDRIQSRASELGSEFFHHSKKLKKLSKKKK